MTQEQFDAWVAEQGGPSAVQHTNENKTIPNPAKTGLQSGNTAIPDTITVNTQTWVNTKTGARLSLAPKGPGQYDVIEQSGAKPVTASDIKPAAPPQEKDEGGRHWVWEPNPNGVGGQWKDVGPAAAKPATPPQERVNPADPTKRQSWDPTANGGQGAWVDSGPVAADPSKPPQERVNPADPTRRQAWDPASSTWVDAGVIAKEAEPQKTRKNPADPGRQQRFDPAVNGGKGDWVDDGPLVTEAPTPAVPSSATGWSPDTSALDMGFSARRKEVAGMLESGVFGDPTAESSRVKANALLKQDWDQADMVSKNLGNIQRGEETVYTGGIRQRSDDVSTVNSRLQAATSIYQTALKEIMAGGHLAKSGAVVVGALKEILENSRIFAQQFGGMVDHERVQPGANMTRTSDYFKPKTPGGAAGAPTVGPQAPGATSVAPGAAPAPEAAPGTPAPAADPFPLEPPPTFTTDQPTAPMPPPDMKGPTIAGNQPFGDPIPTSQDPMTMASRAQAAQQMFGAAPAAPSMPAPLPMPQPVTQAPTVDPAAAASPMIQGAQAPREPRGGTLAWAERLGFDAETIAMFEQLESQDVDLEQPAA